MGNPNPVEFEIRAGAGNVFSLPSKQEIGTVEVVPMLIPPGGTANLTLNVSIALRGRRHFRLITQLLRSTVDIVLNMSVEAGTRVHYLKYTQELDVEGQYVCGQKLGAKQRGPSAC